MHAHNHMVIDTEVSITRLLDLEVSIYNVHKYVFKSNKIKIAEKQNSKSHGYRKTMDTITCKHTMSEVIISK